MPYLVWLMVLLLGGSDIAWSESQHAKTAAPVVVNHYVPQYARSATITVTTGAFTDIPGPARQVRLPQGIAVIIWSVMLSAPDTETSQPLRVQVRPVIGTAAPEEGLSGLFARPPGSDGAGSTGTWGTPISGGLVTVKLQAMALGAEQSLFVGDFEDRLDDGTTFTFPLSASWTVLVFPDGALQQPQ